MKKPKVGNANPSRVTILRKIKWQPTRQRSESESTPPVAVLGFAESVLSIDTLHPAFKAHDIRFLQTAFLAPFYPFPLDWLTVVLAIYQPALLRRFTLIFEGSSHKFSQSVNVEIVAVDGSGLQYSLDENNLKLANSSSPWRIATLDFPESVALIERPSSMQITLLTNNTERKVGGFDFEVYTAPPLTPERIAALRSNPNAILSAEYRIGCKECGSSIGAFASLDSNQHPSFSDSLWYTELPNFFRCSCGKSEIDLTYIKQGFHGILDGRFFRGAHGGILTSRLYEPSALVAILKSFERLLDSSKDENRLQEFLQKHPILLNPFSPQRIIPKAPILASYKTDFAILTTSKDLVLVEIESNSMPITKKDGHPTGKFTHAASQVRDWLAEFQSHRIACLKEMKLRDEEVARVRGAVILGREKPHNPEHIRRLKSGNHGDITILTYDDLLAAMPVLIESLKRQAQQVQ